MSHGQLEPLINRLLRTVGKDRGQLSDAQLVERFVLHDDQAAFESLLWRHGPMILGLCRRLLHHRQDAEDAFQAVFLVFHRKAHTISCRESIASWLYKVAYRIAVKARAQSTMRAADDTRLDALAAPETQSGVLVSAGDDRAIHLWRTATREKVRTFSGMPSRVMHATVCRDGKWLACAEEDGTVHCWDVKTGKKVQLIGRKGGRVDALAFSPDGALLVAAGGDSSLRVWSMSTKARVDPGAWQQEEQAVALVFAPDGQSVAVARMDGTILLRRWTTGAEVCRFSGHHARITRLMFTPDGKSLASSSNDGTVLVWNVPAQVPRQRRAPR